MPGKVLVCAATEGELDTFPETAGYIRLVSGVGIPATLSTLIPFLKQEQVTAILNIGIAGAYPNTGIGIGNIVCATAEVFGDIGFELPEAPHFRSITESPFGNFYREYTLFPPAFATTPTDYSVHFGRGCTVSTCTGTLATGKRRQQQFNAVFETMEGAAVAQAATLFDLPVYEVRAISNIATDRNITPETIRHALASLSDFFRRYREF